MTYFNPKNRISQHAKRLTALALLSTLAACGSTSNQGMSTPAAITNIAPTEVIDQDCLSQASLLAQSADTCKRVVTCSRVCNTPYLRRWINIKASQSCS